MPFNHILVARKRIEYIAYNYVVSEHAIERLKTRSQYRSLQQCILNSSLAWRAPDGYLKIAFSKYEYIVVAITEDEPVVVTFVNCKNSGDTVTDRFLKDYLGEDYDKEYKKSF